MHEEVKAFEDELMELAWSMRGMSLNEIYATSPTQRASIAELYKKHLELTKDSGMPFF